MGSKCAFRKILILTTDRRLKKIGKCFKVRRMFSKSLAKAGISVFVYSDNQYVTYVLMSGSLSY